MAEIERAVAVGIIGREGWAVFGRSGGPLVGRFASERTVHFNDKINKWELKAINRYRKKIAFSTMNG
jgi:hypothetical protein